MSCAFDVTVADIMQRVTIALTKFCFMFMFLQF